MMSRFWQILFIVEGYFNTLVYFKIKWLGLIAFTNKQHHFEHMWVSKHYILVWNVSEMLFCQGPVVQSRIKLI